MCVWGRPMGRGFRISAKRNGMESREGTMGPRTAIPLTPPLVLQSLGISASREPLVSSRQSVCSVGYQKHLPR